MSDKVKKYGIMFTLTLAISLGVLYIGMALLSESNNLDNLERDKTIGIVMMIVGFIGACFAFWAGQRLKQAKSEQRMIEEKEAERVAEGGNIQLIEEDVAQDEAKIAEPEGKND